MVVDDEPSRLPRRFNPLFLRLSLAAWIIATVSWSTCPSFISSVSSQSKMPQQGSSSTRDVVTLSSVSIWLRVPEWTTVHSRWRCWCIPCTARLCTTMILGVVIHMCRRHAAPTKAQVRLYWTAWRSNLPSVNSRRSCFCCCWCKCVERHAKRCDISFVAGDVQEQAQDALVPPLLWNRLTPNDTFLSQSLRSLQYSGPCNSVNCLGHFNDV